jgi:hypothetical protein
MPIAVICPGCKAQFRVSDKFGGKKGPCPKCKTQIEIPLAEEVVIHGPEEFELGGKDSKGRPTSKPIPRSETKVSATAIVAMVAGTIAVVAIAFFTREFIRDNPMVIGAGCLLVAFPLSLFGYSILRDDELEPYRGTGLWVRAGICAAVYAGLWGGFALLRMFLVTPDFMAENIWTWLFVIPPLFVVGGAAAYASLDLDFGSGVFHYGLYLLATVALRFVVGMPHLWEAVPKVAT